MRRALRHRLAFRLGAALFVATAAILLAASAWNLRLQRGHLTRLVVTNAAERADDIRRSTREAMLHNRPGEVGRIIDALASEPPIERIRLFDKRGHIRSSSAPGEIGTLVDVVAEQCVSCHRPGETLSRLAGPERARIFEAADGSRVLGVIAPIRNEAACSEAACHAHPAAQSILGVLDVQLSLRGVDRSLADSERQMLLGLLGTALAVLALSWLLIWWLVLRPVGRLTEGATRVAAGALSTHLPVTSSDEIGEMTAAWNAMIAKLGKAQIVLERWGRTLEQKVEEKTEELERAHQRVLLVEKMASVGKLAAVVAHEINNPLTGIATYARLLRRRRASPGTAADVSSPAEADDADRILELIEEEAGRCGEIVRHLLLLSRSPATRFEEADLRPVLERCLLLLRPEAERRGLDLALELPGDGLSLTCDAAQVEQVVMALALNALEASSDGGSVTLAARLDEWSGEAVLEVRDHGRGIPAEDLERVFEPFFTTKADGDGVGLGLAVVYGIVERHHGRIEVDSRPRAGTVVTVRLPLRQPAADAGDGGDRRDAAGTAAGRRARRPQEARS